MVMVDVSTTGEENIIENGDRKKMNDLEYRKKQLERLQDEVVDLEDISGGISITDLTFNDFKIELMEYMKENREQLEEAPNGMYSIVKIDGELRDTVKPGVIFTLKHVKGFKQSKEQNALFPHYMLYVKEDGPVELNYLHAKKILDYYKKLCSGKRELFMELIEDFNKETNDGRDMSKFSELLKSSIESILGKKEEEGVASLFNKGSTSHVRNNFSGLEEFELVTFLILK